MSIFHMSYHSEFVFDYPAEKVWPHFLDFRKWMTDFNFETLKGSELSEGWLVKTIAGPTALSTWPELPPEPHYHYTDILRVTPFKHFALKVYSEKNGSYGAIYTGFDTYTLVPLSNGKTMAIFDANSEYQLPDMPDEALQKLDEDFHKSLDPRMANYWNNLLGVVKDNS